MVNTPPPLPPRPSQEPPGPGVGSDPLDAFRVGRPRPRHEAKKVDCPQCASQLELLDERTLQAVCASCGSRLFVGQAEAQVLGGRRGSEFGFQLEVGDRFAEKKIRYRVVARLAFIEDGDRSDPTLQYLLYHPTRGSKWLSVYQGHWDLSESTHVMPKSSASGLSPGSELETHDGARWLVRESGVYELAYVDGALPWVAEVGDRTHYVELDAADGSGLTYEVERSGDEMEFGRGRRLSAAEVRRATGEQSIPDPSGRQVDVAARVRGYRFAIRLALLAILINGILALAFLFQGERVLRDSFDAEELTGEAFSEPFEVAADGNVLEIRLDTNLDNAWMSLDVAVARDAPWIAQGQIAQSGTGVAGGSGGWGDAELEVVHVDDQDIEYYHGSDGGESWSEGSRDAKFFVQVPEAGRYRLLVHAVSAHGNTHTSDRAHHYLHVTVYDGARSALWPTVALIASVLILVWQLASRQKWRQGEDE